MDEQLGDLPQKRTLYVSQDYRTWENDVVNQFANNLVGAADGAGNKYLTIFRDTSTTGRYRVLENDRLSEWSSGISHKHFEDFDYSGSGSGFNQFGSLTSENHYNRHLNSSGGTPTAQQAVLSTPSQMDDFTPNGAETNTFDSSNNLTRLDYPDSSYELWQYNSNSDETYYRDRGGFVSLTNKIRTIRLCVLCVV